MSKERAILIREYRDQHGHRATAEHFGLTPGSLTTILYRYKKKGHFDDDVKTPLPTAPRDSLADKSEKGRDLSEAVPGERTIELCRAAPLEEILDAFHVDTDREEVVRRVVNAWPTTAKIDGRMVQIENVQNKVFLRPRFAGIDFEELRRTLGELPKATPLRRIQRSGEPHMLEVNIPDLHYGSLCWASESGENYDMTIAEERFLTAIDRLIFLSSAFAIEAIQFPIGSDFFNVDNPHDSTTAGTPQHSDGRWQKMYAQGVALLIQAIDRLRQVAPVEVILVQGNHDYTLAYCAAHAINLHYSRIRNVSVDWGPTERKFRHYGDCMICYTHGKSANGRAIRDNQWLKIVVAEDDAFSQMKHREVHAAHTHHQTTLEDGPLIIRHLSSLSGTGPYEYSSGYVGSSKTAHAFVWHATAGNVAQIHYTV